jgi:hypothetical protein
LVKIREGLMTEIFDDKDDQLDLLRYLPGDGSEEGLDTLWRQIMVYKAFSDTEVTEAKARRVEAEDAQEQVVSETAEATKQMYQDLGTQADEKTKEADLLKTEAESVLLKAEEERAQAQTALSEAEQASQKMISDAQEQAKQTLDDARKAAQREAADLRRQALKEVKAILARVESVRAAADEELETQRIFSNIAKIKANSSMVLSGQTVNGHVGPTDDLLVDASTGPATETESVPPVPVTAEATETPIADPEPKATTSRKTTGKREKKAAK